MTRLLVVMRLAALTWFTICASCAYPPLPNDAEACTKDADCKDVSAPACVTTLNGGVCVQCTAGNHQACTGNTPRCESNTCVACMDDNDCGGAAGVCLATTGACADPNSILHGRASSTATTGCGDMSNPCSLAGALAIARDMPGKNVIKLGDAGPYTNDGFIVDATVTLDMRGATLHRSNNGPIVTINSGQNLTILGGTIEGAPGSGGDGIRCNTDARLTIHDTTITMNAESGIDASSCIVDVTHATIRDNSTAGGSALFAGIQISNGEITISRSQIISNRGGGITVSDGGKFTIVGNMFFNNGDPVGAAGGFAVTTSASGNRAEFNTFAENKSQLGVGPGIECTATVGFTAENNIIWNNDNSSGVQVDGGCRHAYSDIGPATSPSIPPLALVLDGGNNIIADPMFINEMTDLAVSPMSPVRGKANPTADLSGIASKDINGTVRAARSGAGADLGAYVVPDP